MGNAATSVCREHFQHSAMPPSAVSDHSPLQSETLQVVLVEDDAEFRDAILAPALVAAGCSVIGVGSAAELYRFLVGITPDVLVLDIVLPDESGFEIARHVREHSEIGIIMLTHASAAVDRVRGLDGGADAYLPKPVDVDVLCATVRSVARRLKRVPRDVVHQWALDANGWHLVDPGGKAMPLTAMERRVLRRLFATPNAPVQREAMIADLTEDLHMFDPHRLDMLMHRLRRKVVDNGMPPLPLRAVRGVGYVLVTDGKGD
jgi:DNA-binding response OmpR family regulator